jgi:tRNA threonylcarbamoyladenosine biosynthesis protein TsaB
MTLILNLESSTEVCSVSLSRDGELVDFIENTEGQNHARLLSVYASQVLKNNQTEFGQLNAVSISKGPGSYTGLRIGVSLAKGICYVNQIPLIAISSLMAMSSFVSSNRQQFQLPSGNNLLFCPMIDARRMEVYTALYDRNNTEIEPVSAKVIDNFSFNRELSNHKIVFFGNGSAKCRAEIKHPNALFIHDIKTSAQFMCSLAQEAFENNQFEDVAYFEPFYLKDFIAGIPKKNILKQ